MQELAGVIEQIQAWIQIHAPDALENLRGPVSPGQLNELRATLPAETPDDLFQLLALHDGEEMDSWQSILPDSMLLLPTELILKKYNYALSRPRQTLEAVRVFEAGGANRVTGPVISYDHHQGRIPFAAIN